MLDRPILTQFFLESNLGQRCIQLFLDFRLFLFQFLPLRRLFRRWDSPVDPPRFHDLLTHFDAFPAIGLFVVLHRIEEHLAIELRVLLEDLEILAARTVFHVPHPMCTGVSENVTRAYHRHQVLVCEVRIRDLRRIKRRLQHRYIRSFLVRVFKLFPIRRLFRFKLLHVDKEALAVRRIEQPLGHIFIHCFSPLLLFVELSGVQKLGCLGCRFIMARKIWQQLACSCISISRFLLLKQALAKRRLLQVISGQKIGRLRWTR